MPRGDRYPEPPAQPPQSEAEGRLKVCSAPWYNIHAGPCEDPECRWASGEPHRHAWMCGVLRADASDLQHAPSAPGTNSLPFLEPSMIHRCPDASCYRHGAHGDEGPEEGVWQCHCCYEELTGTTGWQAGFRVVLDVTDPTTVMLRDATIFASESRAAGLRIGSSSSSSSRQPPGPPPPHIRPSP